MAAPTIIGPGTSMGLQRASCNLLSPVENAVILQHTRQLKSWAERLGLSELSSPVQCMWLVYDTKGARRPAKKTGQQGALLASALNAAVLQHTTRRKEGAENGRGRTVVGKRNEEGKRKTGWEETLHLAHQLCEIKLRLSHDSQMGPT